MTDTDRPWWSSGSEPGSRAEPGPAAADREDRQPRTGRASGARTNGRSNGSAGDQAHRGAPDHEDHHEPHDHSGHHHEGHHEHSRAAGPPLSDGEVCHVCPICTALRLVGEVRPDLLVHLAEAARHLTLAAKTVIDAQAAGFGGRGLEHIPLDDDPS